MTVTIRYTGLVLVLAGAWTASLPVQAQEAGAAVSRKLAHDGRIRTLVFSPDGKTLAVGGEQSPVVRLWDVAAGKEVAKLAGHEGGVFSLAFAGDGKTLAAGSGRGDIHLWDRDAAKEKGRLVGHRSGVYSLTFSSDRQRLISGSQDSTVRVWDLAAKRETTQLVQPQAVYALSLMPDGQRLAVGGWFVPVRLLDLQAVAIRLKYQGTRDFTMALALSADASLLASGNRNADLQRTIVVWNATTGTEIQALSGHQNNVMSVAFNRDGRLVLSGSEDGTVRLWELLSGQQVCVLREHTGPVQSVAVSPDGELIASGGNDGVVRLWSARGLLLPSEPVGKLSAAQGDAAWADLADTDAARAQRALWRLVAAPAQAVPLLRERLRAVVADQERITQLIADLDNGQFSKREQATRELVRLGPLVLTALRETLAGGPTLEVSRRINFIMLKLKKSEITPDDLRQLRAVAVLENVGDREAREVLARLAKGLPGARLTREAEASLQRLDRRHPATP